MVVWLLPDLFTCSDYSLSLLKSVVQLTSLLSCYNQLVTGCFPLEPRFTGAAPHQISSTGKMVSTLSLLVDMWESESQLVGPLWSCVGDDVAGHHIRRRIDPEVSLLRWKKLTGKIAALLVGGGGSAVWWRKLPFIGRCSSPTLAIVGSLAEKSCKSAALLVSSQRGGGWGGSCVLHTFVLNWSFLWQKVAHRFSRGFS